MNTTMQALSFGTPLIAIPLAHDQPAIAARLQQTGAGLVIPPGQVSVGKLRSAIDKILEKDSSWQLNARRMQNAISQAGGADRAAGIIAERLLQVPARAAFA